MRRLRRRPRSQEEEVSVRFRSQDRACWPSGSEGRIEDLPVSKHYVYQEDIMAQQKLFRRALKDLTTAHPFHVITWNDLMDSSVTLSEEFELCLY